MRKLTFLLFISITLVFSNNSNATEYEITPFNEYNPEIIGKHFRFKRPIVYLVLDNSHPEFLKRNNGINRMLSISDHSK